MWRIASFADGITNGQIDRSHLGQRHTAWGCRSELRRRQRLQACVLLGIDSVENRNDRGPGSLDETIAHATALDTIELNLTSGHVTSPITLTSGELDLTTALDLEGAGAINVTVVGDADQGEDRSRRPFPVKHPGGDHRVPRTTGTRHCWPERLKPGITTQTKTRSPGV